MSKVIKAKPSIYDIAPYIAGESNAAENSKPVIKLSSNEGAFGPSPMAVQALQKMATTMHRYPESGCLELRQALAQKNNIKAENIICGAGSDEIISLLCQAYAGEEDEVLYSQHGFLMYPISAKAAGATPVTAPEKNLKADPVALLNAVTDKTKILFLANPNNPTGSYLTTDEVADLHAKLPPNVLLVLDAAYAEYVDAPDYSAGHDLAAVHDNVVVTRTFSKLYALGGLRLGWGHASDAVIDVLNRVRGPFNVGASAQAAGLAALNDNDFIEMSRAHNTKARAWVVDELTKLRLIVYPSECNFLLVSLGDDERAEQARLHLKEDGILVRQMDGYGLPKCLRITIGTDDEMVSVIESLKKYLD